MNSMSQINFLTIYYTLIFVIINKILEMSAIERAGYDENCPELDKSLHLKQTQLIQRLTHVCRYDRLERPAEVDSNGKRLPTHVRARVYVFYMQNLNADLLQFKVHVLLQLNFRDRRLAFKEYAPNRTENLLGKKHLSERLWLPHIFFANEHESSILGTDEKDVLTSISPDGQVTYSTRIKATLYCWMNFKKFPFDEQYCSTVLESWMYNTSDMVLEWEENSPISFDPDLHLTEYNMQRYWYNATTVIADGINMRHGAFIGNYSSLNFTITLNREIGFYLMDYFLPSMMLVAISWVSFWLQADATAPRIMLGTSTMLSFITLSSSQSKNLPKVSYIKVSEVWFFGCTFFIFGSLVEFAFVNTIWRRKGNVALKKVNSKYIIKSTLTPRTSRRQIGLTNEARTRSCSSLYNMGNSTESIHKSCSDTTFNNYLTVHNVPIITMQAPENETTPCNENHATTRIINMENGNSGNNMSSNKDINTATFTTMTPQEIAMWIDRRSRFLFPVTFLIFNAIFWTFVYYF